MKKSRVSYLTANVVLIVLALLAMLMGFVLGINVQLNDYLRELDRTEQVIIEAQEAAQTEKV